jgi:hypothetical protein
MRSRIALMCLTSLLSTTANALTYRQFKAAKDHPQSTTWQATQAYLDGIQAGLDNANRQMRNNGQKQFYCAPIDLNVDNLADLVEASFAKVKGHNGITEDKSDIAVALFFELQFRFPCK